MPRPPPQSTTAHPLARRRAGRGPVRRCGRRRRGTARARRIWLPICIARPTRLDPRQRGGVCIERGGARRRGCRTCSRARPVVILACVPASTSGLTRSATRAMRPMPAAIAESIASSSALSTLIWAMSSAEREAQIRPRSCRRRRTRSRRGNAGGAGAQQFARADHVGAGALAAEQAQHGQMVVRLDRVMDMRRQARLGQRRGEGAEPGADRGGAADPGRGADGLRDGGERHAFQQQPVHRVAGEVRTGGDQRVRCRIGMVGRGGEIGGHESQSTTNGPTVRPGSKGPQGHRVTSPALAGEVAVRSTAGEGARHGTLTRFAARTDLSRSAGEVKQPSAPNSRFRRLP